MNALTASLIVVVIGAAAFIVAASITARSRIGVLPAEPVQVPSGSSHLWPGLPEAAKQCRVFGWVLVVLLYLLAVFCLLQGLNALRIVHHWQEWQASFGSVLNGQAEIALYSRFWIALATVLCVIGYWAQRRLRRRAYVVAELCKYCCVLASAAIDVCMEDCLLEYCERASDQRIANYIKEQLARARKPSTRLKDEELILRFFALLHWGDKYRKPMREFLDDFLDDNRDFELFGQAALSTEFSDTIATAHSVLGDKAFRVGQSLNAAIYDSVMVGLAKRLAKGPIKDNRALEGAYLGLFKDKDYEAAFIRATSDDESVRNRLRISASASSNTRSSRRVSSISGSTETSIIVSEFMATI